MFVTVAGAGGAALPPATRTLRISSPRLQAYGNPNVAIYPQSFLETPFVSTPTSRTTRIRATAVQAAIRTLLTQTYSFASRTFGQGVSGDEIAALDPGRRRRRRRQCQSAHGGRDQPGGDIGSAAFSVSLQSRGCRRR